MAPTAELRSPESASASLCRESDGSRIHATFKSKVSICIKPCLLVVFRIVTGGKRLDHHRRRGRDYATMRSTTRPPNTWPYLIGNHQVVSCTPFLTVQCGERLIWERLSDGGIVLQSCPSRKREVDCQIHAKPNWWHRRHC